MLKRHPCAVIDTVEKYQAVVDAAREYFALDDIVCHVDTLDSSTMSTSDQSGEDHALYSRFRSVDRSLCRSRVVVGDALDFVRTYHADSGLDYDVVSLDVFEGIDSNWFAQIDQSFTNAFELLNMDSHKNSVFYQSMKFVAQRQGLVSFYLHNDQTYDRHKTMIQDIFGESFVHSFSSCSSYSVLVASCYRNSRCNSNDASVVNTSTVDDQTDELLMSCDNRKKLYDRVFVYMSKMGSPTSTLHSNYVVVSQCKQ